MTVHLMDFARSMVVAVALLALLAESQALAHGAGRQRALPPDGVLQKDGDLLLAFFPKAERVRFARVTLSEAQRADYARYVGQHTRVRRPIIYLASRRGRIEGLAVLAGAEPRVGVKLAPGGVVERVEVLRLRDSHGADVLDSRFLKQFVGASAADPLKAHDDIQVGERCHRTCIRTAQHVRHAVWLAQLWAASAAGVGTET